MDPAVFDLLFSEGPIRALQRFSSPLVDAAFVALTTTGGVVFLLVLVVLLYWLVDKRLAFVLGVALLASWALNGFLKDLFGMARPPPELHIPSEVGGNGFPSGHTQGAATFWTSVGAEQGGAWVVAGAAMIVLVALSRVYLGVHYVGDVLGGLAFGLLVAAAFVAADRWDLGAQLGLRGRVAAAFLLPMALLGSFQLLGYAAPAVSGLLLGVAVGYVLEGAWVDLPPPAGRRAAALRVLLGVPAALGAYLGVLALSGYALLLAGHAGLGLLVSLVLPWVFARVEAAGPSSGSRTV